MADEDGQVDFRPDAYGWDEKLIAALGQEAPAAGLAVRRAALSRASTDCAVLAD